MGQNTVPSHCYYRDVRIPPHVHRLPVLDLPIGRKVVDALLHAGVLWLGDLHGRSLAYLLTLRGLGPQTASRLLRGLAAIAARSKQHEPVSGGDHGRAGGQPGALTRDWGGQRDYLRFPDRVGAR